MSLLSSQKATQVIPLSFCFFSVKPNITRDIFTGYRDFLTKIEISGVITFLVIASVNIRLLSTVICVREDNTGSLEKHASKLLTHKCSVNLKTGPKC